MGREEGGSRCHADVSHVFEEEEEERKPKSKACCTTFRHIAHRSLLLEEDVSWASVSKAFHSLMVSIQENKAINTVDFSVGNLVNTVMKFSTNIDSS